MSELTRITRIYTDIPVRLPDRLVFKSNLLQRCLIVQLLLSAGFLLLLATSTFSIAHESTDPHHHAIATVSKPSVANVSPSVSAAQRILVAQQVAGTLGFSNDSDAENNRAESTAAADSVTPSTGDDASQPDSRNSVINGLTDALAAKSGTTRMAAIHELVASGAPRLEIWLQALIDGKIYIVKSDQVVVVAEKQGREYQLHRADDGLPLGSVSKRALKKVSVNNRMRSEIRGLVATLALEDPVAEKRLLAVEELFGKADGVIVERVRILAEQEPDASVASTMRLLVAIEDLKSGSTVQQNEAFSRVTGSLDANVLAALREIVATDADAESTAVAAAMLSDAEKRIRWYGYIETAFFGISLGSVLVIAAIGLALTFGVMGVINMAHGELIMLGAYTTWAVQQMFPAAIEYSLLLAIPAAFLVSGATGVLIERTVIRHLYGRALETLLATFGISLLLQQLVRTVVSPQNVAVINPSWMSGSLQINPVLALTLNRLVIVFFCLLVFGLLYLFLSRSGFGLQMRAVAQNRQMARAMGIRSSRIDALTFGLGAGIAGIAGVALSQIGNVGPNLGQNYIIDSFLVVVFGGVGSLWGTLVAGMSLGIVNKAIEPWAGAVLAKILLLVFVILFIQKRPRGLFPQRGRAAEAS